MPEPWKLLTADLLFAAPPWVKVYERYPAGTNIVLLDADIAEVFPTSQNVNDALRVLIRAAQGKVMRLLGGVASPGEMFRNQSSPSVVLRGCCLERARPVML